jgi:hypothetical protein
MVSLNYAKLIKEADSEAFPQATIMANVEMKAL